MHVFPPVTEAEAQGSLDHEVGRLEEEITYHKGEELRLDRGALLLATLVGVAFPFLLR